MKTGTSMGIVVAFIRLVAGLTQEQLGERMGTNRQFVADLEREKTAVTWDVVERVLRCSGTDAHELAPLVAKVFVRGMGLEVIGDGVVEAAEASLTNKARVAMGPDQCAP